MATIWSLLQRKDVFYMILLEQKSYVPELIGFCGDLIKIEEVRGNINHYPEDSKLFNFFLSSSIKSLHYVCQFKAPFQKQKVWPRLYKIKISLGILEFFIDSPSFNPNEEFGPDSLYLCSPIRESFGYSFILDAKLLKYDHLYTGRELAELMNKKSCTNDFDCVFTNDCITKCIDNKCSSQLIRPQLVNYCLFLENYLNDTHLYRNQNFRDLINQCIKLDSISIDLDVVSKAKSINFLFNFEELKLNAQREVSWNKIIEYSMLTDRLKEILWKEIKLVDHPIRIAKEALKSFRELARLKN
jgi:hypothetical protein